MAGFRGGLRLSAYKALGSVVLVVDLFDLGFGLGLGSDSFRACFLFGC